MIKPDSEYPLALVTGAARRVGRKIALHLASKGYAVVLHYFRSEDEAAVTGQEISKLGVPVYPLKADLSDPQQIVSLFDKISELPHVLHVTVNSAAVMVKSNLLEINLEEWDSIIDLNTRAVWLCSKASAKLMLNGGVILNLSDVGVQKNWTGYGAYIISKAGVEALTRIMAKQLAPDVRVCGIAPGLIEKGEMVSDQDWLHLVHKVPMQREAAVKDLTDTIDFLLENEYITGEIISLAGGSQLG